MSKLHNNQAGFSALEITLIIIIIAIIAGIGGYVLRSSKTANNTLSAANRISTNQTTKKNTNAIKELDITEWKVRMTLLPGLDRLSYEMTSPTTETAYRGPNNDQPYTLTQPGYVKLISLQLKGQPSSCTGEATTSGEFASIERSTTNPNNQPNDGVVSADYIRKIGSNYYTLSMPNGLSCQSSESLKAAEAKQSELVKQAFKSLRAQ